MTNLNRLINFTLILIIIWGCGKSSDKPASKADMVVTAEWLNTHLNDPDLILLHVGQKALYDSLHIPGAQFIRTQELSLPREEGKLALELPPISQIDSILENHGVSNTSKIVLYFGKDWVSPTTRIYFILDYAGLENNTSILDGGMPAWQRSGYPVTREIPKYAKGKLNLQADDNKLADYAEVKSDLYKSDVRIVDARSAQYYSGKDDGKGRIKRPGHIPGAINLVYYSIVDDSLLTFKPLSEIDSLFNSNGISKDKEIISYSHIGQQATVIYFAAKYRGSLVKLYDGSYEDWENHAEAKVENSEIK